MKAPAGRRAAEKKVSELTPSFVEQAALAYLNRFDAPVAKLRSRLLLRVRRRFGLAAHDPQLEQVSGWIDAVLLRFVESGILDDARYALTLAASARRRGASRRGVSEKLRRAGLTGELAKDAIASADATTEEPEAEAAARLVRRRRLGWCRSEEQRRERWARDLAVLARAGFSRDVALRALRGPEDRADTARHSSYEPAALDGTDVEPDAGF